MPRSFTFFSPDELTIKITEESERLKVTYTEVILQAVKEYFRCDKQRAYEQAVLYEIVKNRAVLLRCFDMAGKELTGEVLEEAAMDAEAYLAERKKPERI